MPRRIVRPPNAAHVLAVPVVIVLLMQSSAPSPEAAAAAPVGAPAAAVVAPAAAEDAAAAAVRAVSLPLSFERNDGQHAAELGFVGRGDGFAFGLSRDAVHVALPRGDARFTLRLAGAAPGASPEGEAPLAGRANYLIGPDAGQWRTGIPTFARIRYGAVWPGIDVLFYGNQRQLEYDAIVAAGADPSVARFAFEGVDAVRVGESGDLLLSLGARDVRYSRPLAYQSIDGQRIPVAADYVVEEATVSFRLGAFDRRQPLVIDPVLLFATYLGGNASDRPSGVAVDAAGSTYITGWTSSSDFPTTPGRPYGYQGSVDVFVTKIAPNGAALVYSTYVGGAGYEAGSAIAVDPQGAAYVAGLSETGAFPTTPGAYQTSRPGKLDPFIFKLSADGSALVYSTYLGGAGNDQIRDIAVDTEGWAYVTGTTDAPGFPVTASAYDTTFTGFFAAFITKLHRSGGSLAYSTLIDGDFTPRGIALDRYDPIVVGDGMTFPETIPPPAGWGGGSTDGIILKLKENGTGLRYARRFGGSTGEILSDVAVTADREVAVTGQTTSSDLPLTAAAEQTALASVNGDALFAVFSPDAATLRHSTYVGGSEGDIGGAIATSNASITIFGTTISTDFPTTPGGLSATNSGGADTFIVKYQWFGSAGFRAFSTLYGGSQFDDGRSGTVDGAGRATFAGSTGSADLPLRRAIDPSPSPDGDGFVARIGAADPGAVGDDDVVVHVASASMLFGNWQEVADPSAAGGARLFSPDVPVVRGFPPSPNPPHYFEFEVSGLSDGPYRIYLRGRALNDLYEHDSVFVQFDAAYDDGVDAVPDRIYEIGTSNALPVVIEECSGCGVRGWGWADGGYGRGAIGPRLFFPNGTPVRVRISTREDGVSIDQVVFASEDSSPYAFDPPGYQKGDATILPATAGGGGNEALEIVLYAGVDNPQLNGAWQVIDDPTAAGGKRLFNPDARAPKVNTPSANPADYVDLTFDAIAGVNYTWHIRGRAQRDDPYNDSVFVQFSNAAPLIGTTQAVTVNLEVCASAGLAGWGWRDGEWCDPAPSPGTSIVFSTSGSQTIRIQTREDGVSIDQIVFSAGTYAGTAPGPAKNDSTIVPR